MAFSWIEVYLESRPFDIDRSKISKEFTFIITTNEDRLDHPTRGLPGTDLAMWLDDDEVHKEVSYIFASGGAVFPLFYEFEWYDGIPYLLWVSKVSGVQLNWNQWKISVTFSTHDSEGSNQGGQNNDPEKNTENYTQISFNTTTISQNIPRAFLREGQGGPPVPVSLNNVSSLVPGTEQFIGFTDEGVEGVDILVRTFTFSITQYMNPRKLTAAYLRRLTKLVTCLNLVPFFGFAPYSVMCTGSNGTGNAYSSVPVTLDFEVRPNFKFSNEEATRLAPVDDVFIPGPQGPVVDVSQQFNIYHEEEFAPTKINNIAGTTPYSLWDPVGMGALIPLNAPVPQMNLPQGVHSGWSVVSYRYKEEVKPAGKAVVKTPVERMIYLPKEYIPINFVQFLL